MKEKYKKIVEEILGLAGVEISGITFCCHSPDHSDQESLISYGR